MTDAEKEINEAIMQIRGMIADHIEMAKKSTNPDLSRYYLDVARGLQLADDNLTVQAHRAFPGFRGEFAPWGKL